MLGKTLTSARRDQLVSSAPARPSQNESCSAIHFEPFRVKFWMNETVLERDYSAGTAVRETKLFPNPFGETGHKSAKFMNMF